MSASPVTKVAAIAAMNLRRFVRDRTNLLFVFVMPIAIIVLIGLQYTEEPTPRLGVVGEQGGVAEEVLAAVGRDGDVELEEVGDADELARQVESGDLTGGVVFPDDLDERLAQGHRAGVRFVVGSSNSAQQLRAAVDGALAEATSAATAAHTAVERGADPAAAQDAADRLAGQAPAVGVRVVTAGDRLFPAGTEGYEVAGPSQLVLFTFVTGLTGSYALIQSRQLGLSRRMLSTPTPPAAIITGEALGRWCICMVQALYVLVATMLLFGLDWGDPLGAAALVVLVAAVSAAAAMVFGTVFSNPDQASGVGVIVALGLAALGGAMLPLELFSDGLRTVARFTPHYWAVEGFGQLVRHDRGVADILPQLGMLAAWAGVLLTLATWRMRVVLTRAAR